MGIIRAHPTVNELMEFPFPVATGIADLERIVAHDSHIYINNGDVGPRPFSICGITPYTHGYSAWGWAAFNPPVSYHEARYVIDHMRTLLRQSPYQRVETSVRADSWSEIKLAETLGMELEGLMRKYGPVGEDHLLYAYIKWDQ